MHGRRPCGRDVPEGRPAQDLRRSRRTGARRRLRPSQRVGLRAVAALSLFACVVVGAGCAGSHEEAHAQPDVVLIVIDTARADRFGCYGYTRDTTPNIDAFARDAVLYRGARSTAPWTVPAHASIFTGLRVGEHGLHWSPQDDGKLVTTLREPARARLLAALLAERGYTTFGVSNNPWVSDRTGFDAGFDTFYSVAHAAADRATLQRWLGDRSLPETTTAVSFDLFRRHLDEHLLDPPFFVFFNLMEPHFPYLPPADHAGRFGGDPEAMQALLDRRLSPELAMLGGVARPDPALLSPLYDEELAAVDAAIGRFFASLQHADRYDDALIIVTSDHGEHLGEAGRYSHQLSVDDALLEVPLLVKYPGNAGAGTVVDAPLVSVTDVHQTVLAAAWPDNPLAGGWSQDLRHVERFARDWSLSEYYYSPTYLDQIQRVAPVFDTAPHRVVRRVVVTPDGAVELADAPSQGELARLPGAVASELNAYLAEIGVQGTTERRRFTSEDLEALRALGYVE